MDLWIRSQDKRELRPNPKLGIDEVENKEEKKEEKVIGIKKK